MLKLKKAELNQIDLAVINAVHSWGYYNCSQSAMKQLTDDIKKKLNQFVEDNNEI